MNLIPLHTNTINGAAAETISARELHVFIESKQDFSTWIKARIEDYGFVENQDFVRFHKKMEANNATLIEYYLTLDMAKELAMVERNAKGKEARQYFIECEKRLRARNNPQTTGILIAPANDFTALVGAMKAIGLDTNAAAISANQAVLATAGVNILQLTGNTHLLAEKQERWYTPTELGRMCDPVINPRNINLLLAAHDLQVKTGDVWVALQAGEEYSRLFDTGKRHGNGAPVLQLKWSNRVLDIIMPKH